MADILIGEDEPDIALAMQLLFTRAGHHVRLTTDGPGTLNAAVAQPPDLLMLNLVMPGMHGTDVCRALRLNPPTAGLPIIVVSAWIDHGGQQAVLNAGANHCQLKPFTNTDLLDRAQRLLATPHPTAT